MYLRDSKKNGHIQLLVLNIESSQYINNWRMDIRNINENKRKMRKTCASTIEFKIFTVHPKKIRI